MVSLDDTDAEAQEMAELGALLHQMSLSGDASDPRPTTPPRRSIPAPRTPSRPAQNVPYTHPCRGLSPSPSHPPAAAVYHIRSPNKTGFTSSWSRAAAETQGIPNASTQRVFSKPAAGKRSKKGGIAVFHGTSPGAYPDWATAAPLVIGVPGSLYKGYRTLQAAQAAFNYATSKSWTRVCPSRNGLRSSLVPPPSSHIPTLPQPVGYNEGPNPLCDVDDDDPSPDDGTWYIVYAGITPGVYQSSLEYSLNTVGLSCATYDSVRGKENAIRMYQEALARGDVSVLTHRYTS